MEAVPAELLQLVRETTGNIRIVADAHLEWLDLVVRCRQKIPPGQETLYGDRAAPGARVRVPTVGVAPLSNAPFPWLEAWVFVSRSAR
jgi:hypothetical protein